MARRLATLIILAIFLFFSGCAQENPVNVAVLDPSSGSKPNTNIEAPLDSDFTKPNAAQEMTKKLMQAADVEKLFLLEITSNTVTINSIKDGKVVSWSYRDGKIQKIRTDAEDVKQAYFFPDEFNYQDVGQIFRMAAAISGSDSNQQLRIVDSGNGNITMSVSTVPESKAVFFEKTGKPLPLFDYTTASGITHGLEDITQGLTSVTEIKIDNEVACVSFPSSGTQISTRIRHSNIPSSTTTKKQENIITFEVSKISAKVIYQKYQELLGKQPSDTKWSVIIKKPSEDKPVEMLFTVGEKHLKTDIAGIKLS